ncbi:hypothetical protein GCM10027160_37450 [Streptomyces calidiresistens]|uniref:Uncharacterized protein n=1 Tax=Streptomyces calidiresistens TaxID=1485586 RepID=A0A7W3T520_9ACTN|nr:hypothetical protein [Streptomyces calidiresistens]MBB0231072.1 hypothetical protein [Streptomyces calidiresistens]
MAATTTAALDRLAPAVATTHPSRPLTGPDGTALAPLLIRPTTSGPAWRPTCTVRWGG